MSASALAKTHAPDDYDLTDIPVEDLARRGWEIKAHVQALQDELAAINETLKTRLPTGETVTVKGVCSIRKVERQAVKIADVETLKSALGPSFGMLVKTDIAYKKTDKLEELAFSGDGGLLTEAVRGCLSVSITEAIDWRAA